MRRSFAGWATNSPVPGALTCCGMMISGSSLLIRSPRKDALGRSGPRYHAVERTTTLGRRLGRTRERRAVREELLDLLAQRLEREGFDDQRVAELETVVDDDRAREARHVEQLGVGPELAQLRGDLGPALTRHDDVDQQQPDRP